MKDTEIQHGRGVLRDLFADLGADSYNTTPNPMLGGTPIDSVRRTNEKRGLSALYVDLGDNTGVSIPNNVAGSLSEKVGSQVEVDYTITEGQLRTAVSVTPVEPQ